MANLWTELTTFDWYAMATNRKECKMLNNFLVAATFEKANTYVFAGMVIMNPREMHAPTLLSA